MNRRGLFKLLGFGAVAGTVGVSRGTTEMADHAYGFEARGPKVGTITLGPIHNTVSSGTLVTFEEWSSTHPWLLRLTENEWTPRWNKPS